MKNDIALIYRIDFDEFDTFGETSKIIGWIEVDNSAQTISLLSKKDPPLLENRPAYMMVSDPDGKHNVGYPLFICREISKIEMKREKKNEK